MAVDCDRWNWRELLASEDSHLPPTTRLVLLTLSLHMNVHGANAWPSQELLAKRTGLSERAIREHLAIAQKQDWIQITQRRRPGQAWFSHQYFPMIPAALAEKVKAASCQHDPKWERPERGSARSPQHPANGARHPEPRSSTPGTSFLNTRNHVPPNSSSNYPLNQSKERLLTQTDPGLCERGKTQEPEVQQRKPSISDEGLLAQAYETGQHCNHKVATIAKILSARYLDVTEDRLWRVIRADQAARAQRQQYP